jgi:NAD(P)-dependent dehydrogenase (short-subunit alcohol dehydrogenase family)
MTLQGKRALVLGGSSGVGRATVKLLISEGAQVVVVARGGARLEALQREVGAVVALPGDGTDEAFVERALRDHRPDMVVVAAGVTPRMGPLVELDWGSFSASWDTDLKTSFFVVKQALTQPLAVGSTVVVVSSGAALHGSPLSGGYAGAKRMQWWLASYAQRASDAKKTSSSRVRRLALRRQRRTAR